MLADAQLAIARDYGFASWRSLHAHVSEAHITQPTFDADAFARRAVKRMKRGWAESDAVIEQHFADTGEGPQWESAGLQSPTMLERDADVRIERLDKLGLYRMISIWHHAKTEANRRAFMDFPPTRSLEFYRDGYFSTKPSGGIWQRIDVPLTWAKPLGRAGRWEDLAEALRWLRHTAPAGEYRVITVRRMLLAKREKAKLKIIKKHAAPSFAPLAPVDREHPSKTTWAVEHLPERRKSHKIAQWKPIVDAAFAGDAAKVQKLLDAGADPNVISTTPHRYRPLHRAIEHKKTAPKHEGHERVVKLLLSRGADPKLRATLNQISPLQLAATGEPRFIPILLPHFEPMDIFHACVVLDDERVRELLRADSSQAKSVDANGWTLLHYTAASAVFKSSENALAAQVRMVRALIDAGANPAAAYLWNDQWPIPVMYFSAGLHNNPAITKLLLDAGAEPFDGESIYHAADEGHQECLDLFAALDAKKLAKECTGCLTSQLHWGHTRGAKWLLEHGADPNAIHPRYGESALHAAIRSKSSDAVFRLLFKHGADVNVKTKDGKTAMQLARKAGLKMVERLKLLR
jgi:ankyrin repeat protein